MAGTDYSDDDVTPEGVEIMRQKAAKIIDAQKWAEMECPIVVKRGVLFSLLADKPLAPRGNT